MPPHHFRPQSGENAGEISIDKARALYSLLENINGQKSLFQEEVDIQNLKGLLNEKYSSREIRIDENEQRMTFSGINIKVDSKRKIIVFYTFINPEREVSEEDAVRFCNKFNGDKIFLNTYWFDKTFGISYYLTYDGGIHADNFNSTISWFFSLTYDFMDSMTEANMLKP